MSTVKISSVLGNSQRLDGGSMFGNAPRAVWQSWIAPDDLGRIPLACRAMLVEINNQKILCETGIGCFFEPKLADRFGVENSDRHILLENLNSLGVEEANIDYVILSHLHFDHAGGLLPQYKDIQAGKKDLLFPNAKYVVGKEAWSRAIKPHFRDRASFIPGLTDKLENSGRLIIVEDETHAEVLPEFISFRYSHGHTPGQMHTVVKGEKASIIFAGDLIPGTSWVHLPITMGYDRFAEQVIDEKQALYETAVPKHWWFFYTHDHKLAMSKIACDEKGKYAAVEEVESPRDFLI